MTSKISIKTKVPSERTSRVPPILEVPVTLKVDHYDYHDLNIMEYYSSRENMIKHRNSLMELLNIDRHIIIHLEKVIGMSHSAADELIGVLILHFGIDKVLNRIKVLASSDVIDTIANAINARRKVDEFELNSEQYQYLVDQFNDKLNHHNIYIQLPVDLSKFHHLEKMKEHYNIGFWEIHAPNPIDKYSDDPGINPNAKLILKGTQNEKVLVPTHHTFYYCPLYWDYYKGSDQVLTYQGRRVPFLVAYAELNEIDNTYYWNCKIIKSEIHL